jgi:hypothetical protein
MNKLAKDTAKSHLAKINHKIKQLRKDINTTSNMADIDTSTDKCLNKILLEKELEHLKRKSYKNAHLKAQARWSTQGETISKYWSRINKPRKLRDVISRLRISNTNKFIGS